MAARLYYQGGNNVFVYFDLDRVLVDIDRGWSENFVRPLAHVLHKSEEDVAQVGREIWMSDRELYTPETHMWRLRVRASNKEAAAVLASYYDWLDSGAASYADVKNFFLRMKGTCRFAVITFGSQCYQRRKYAALPIEASCVEYFHAAERHGQKGRIISSHARLHTESIFFVDDNPGEHEAAVDSCPSATRIQIKRSASIPHSLDAHFHVRNLAELEELLTSLR